MGLLFPVFEKITGPVADCLISSLPDFCPPCQCCWDKAWMLDWIRWHFSMALVADHPSLANSISNIRVSSSHDHAIRSSPIHKYTNFHPQYPIITKFQPQTAKTKNCMKIVSFSLLKNRLIPLVWHPPRDGKLK